MIEPKKISDKKMDKENLENIIDAALFISARELNLSEIGELIGVKRKSKIKDIVERLKIRYENQNGAIEIARNGEKYSMRLRSKYVDYVREFAQDSEISRGALKVLSYIHMNKDNILKSKIAKKLGAWIYIYVKELEEKEFIVSKKAGRTKLLITTDKFKRYFSNE